MTIEKKGGRGREVMRRTPLRVLASAAIALLSASASAGDRLAWTGGVTQVEGAAGGGLVPWALTAGLGTEDQTSPSFFATHVSTDRFALRVAGASLGVRDRLELSYARHEFDLGSLLPGLELRQDVVGAKVRVAGDAVFSPSDWLPQIAVGAQWKRTRDFDVVPRAAGARSGSGVDVYVAATRLWFDAVAGRNVLANVTLRRTQANQFGLLGFGGDRGRGPRWYPEASVAVWLTDSVLVGAEWRAKPNGLSAFEEEDARDAFVAWNPAKRVSIVGAWADLGTIAGQRTQRGPYVSAWFAY